MVMSEGFVEGKKNGMRGAHIILRPLTNADEPLYLAQFSSLVQATLQVASLNQEQIYFRERIAKQHEGKTFFYGIFDAQSNVLCGALEIRDKHEHRGQLYCWLNEAWWGKGYMQEAIALGAADYFAHTKERFITAFVDESNKRSYWALKRAGFADLCRSEGPHGKQYELVYRNKSEA